MVVPNSPVGNTASITKLEIEWSGNIVSVLWREEGYTVKCSLSTREILRAEPGGFTEGSGYISLYILTWVTIQSFSMSKSYTDSMVHPGRAILKSWYPYWSGSWGYNLPYCLVDKAIWVLIDPVENSVVTAVWNTHGQESNTIRGKFQYYSF